jgi:hypothetical protein
VEKVNCKRDNRVVKEELGCILTNLEHARELGKEVYRLYSKSSEQCSEFETAVFKLLVYLENIADNIKATYGIKHDAPNVILAIMRKEFSEITSILEKKAYGQLPSFLNCKDEEKSVIVKLIKEIDKTLSGINETELAAK